MEGKRIGILQKGGNGLTHLLGRGDAGIAQAVIVDLVRAYNGGSHSAVFKKLSDAGPLCAEGVCMFVYHNAS